jgi:pyrroline-5-carboxylate reductase
MERASLALIGGGNMGGAILRAVVSQGIVPAERLLLVEPEAEKAAALSEATGCAVQSKMDGRVSEYELLLLATKPQGAPLVLAELRSHLIPEQTVVSVMAGISLTTLRNGLGHERLVRTMPNTPAQLGEGMTVVYADPAVPEASRKQVQAVFGACGTCLEVDHEDAIDAATAVSGSGPAYVFYLAEQMMVAAQDFGFSESAAQTLVQKTLRGAILLWEQKGVSAATLRRQVTSPGGTTEAAVTHFESQAVGQHLQEGLQKAYQRAKELAR